MHFKKIEEFGNLEMAYVSDFSGGFISRNSHIDSLNSFLKNVFMELLFLNWELVGTNF